MPTYEYQCKGCSHRFETWQKMSDEPLTVCPVCGGTIRRVLFPAGVVFKGSGFYKTDHANGSGAENGHAAKSDGAESTKAGETGTAASGESKSSSETSSASTSESASSKSGTTGTTGENKAAAAKK